MRQLLIGVGVVGLLIGVPLVGAAQEQEQGEEAEVFPLTDDEIEIAGLKIDLLNAMALTLQWKRESLVRDQNLLRQNDQLLVQENTAWRAWQADLQEELNVLFGCEYDFDARACPEGSDDEPAPDEEPIR